MPSAWKRKAFMRDGELITLKRLVRFGYSYAFVLPKDWVRYRCKPDENGKHWVEIKYDYNKAVFTISGYQGEEE